MKIYRIDRLNRINRIDRIAGKIPSSFIRGEDQEYLNVVPGEAGTGIYFSPEVNKSMVDHYIQTAKHVVRAIPRNAHIIDMTESDIYNKFLEFADERIEGLSREMQHYIKPKINRSNFQRFGNIIEDFLNQNYPDIDGYLVPHIGPGIPTGKQLVMRNEDAFDIEWLK